MLPTPSCLLLNADTVQTLAVSIQSDPDTLVLTMRATASQAVCPLCSQVAERVHSHYSRHPADVSWALVPVRIVLQVRRFFCDTPDCPRRIFTERLPTVLEPYARRTTRLARVQQQLGLLVGGSVGAVVGALVGFPGGIDLLLALALARRCRSNCCSSSKARQKRDADSKLPNSRIG